MTAKYPMPEPHVHAELIKSWADGAVIQAKVIISDGFEDVHYPSWLSEVKYIVNPRCDYAKAKIAEFGGDDKVELYLYWLDGGELEFRHEHNDVFSKCTSANEVTNHYKLFIDILDRDIEIRKKKRMVKQVGVINSSFLNLNIIHESRIVAASDMYLLVTNLEGGKILGVYKDEDDALEAKLEVQTEPSYVGQKDYCQQSEVIRISGEVI